MKERIRTILNRTVETHRALADQCELIERMGLRLAGVLVGGGSLYVMGNGGSAADSQHMASELVGRFQMERRSLPCHALSTDTSALTAIGNDYGFEQVFARQVKAFATERDAVLGISASGDSANVLAGIQAAHEAGALTLGLTGASGGALAGQCDLCLCAPARETPRIQEVHATVIHILCEIIETQLFGDS